MRTQLLCPLFLLAAAGTAHAAIVTSTYTFSTNNDAANSDAAQMSSGSLSFGSGWTPIRTSDDGDASFPATPVLFEHWSVTTNKVGTGSGPFGEHVADSETAARDDGDYIELTVSPQGGKTLKFQTVTFDLAIGATGSTNGMNFFLRSDAEASDYTTTLGSASSTTTAVAAKTITLTGFSYLQNVTTPVTFRLYGYDRGSTSSSNNRSAWHLDNLAITADVIPEPGAIGLLAVGLPLALHRRRR